MPVESSFVDATSKEKTKEVRTFSRISSSVRNLEPEFERGRIAVAAAVPSPRFSRFSALLLWPLSVP